MNSCGFRTALISATIALGNAMLRSMEENWCSCICALWQCMRVHAGRHVHSPHGPYRPESPPHNTNFKGVKFLSEITRASIRATSGHGPPTSGNYNPGSVTGSSVYHPSNPASYNTPAYVLPPSYTAPAPISPLHSHVFDGVSPLASPRSENEISDEVRRLFSKLPEVCTPLQAPLPCCASSVL
jgi:hypothetical protein